ncbi:GlxA family transcriptional regulator [Undibacterium sp.]|uniref:GlxA family transcriptional regulator n=1 Tax=Undibacterium sp. TaxID=1914977 RepID=UPI00374D9553
MNISDKPTASSVASSMVRIGILVYPGCLRSGVIVPVDVFRIAALLMQARPAAQRVQISTCWISARGGGKVDVDGVQFDTLAPDAEQLDVLMVPGMDHRSPDDLARHLPGLVPEQELVRRFLHSKRLLLASCSGTCLAAQTGLLDGRRTTTSWWLAPYFRRQYPRVILEAEPLVVQDGMYVSSGGVASYLDLSLWLLGHFAGDELRQMTARILVTDDKRSSQAPYVAAALLQGHGNAVIERARRWLNQRLDSNSGWDIAGLATHCNISSRTLLRRFHETLGVSPAQYVQQLRVERGKALLETTLLSHEEIAGRCGYSDVSTFSKIFKQQARLTPAAYRSRFGLRS